LKASHIFQTSQPPFGAFRNRKQTRFFFFCKRCKQIIEQAENPLFGY